MELKVEDLVFKCQKCGGAGWIRENFNRSSSYGTNVVSHEGPCEECAGRGVKLTENGKSLVEAIALMKRGQFIN